MGLVMQIKTRLEANAPTLLEAFGHEKKGKAMEIMAKDVKWSNYDRKLKDANIVIIIEEEENRRIVGIASARAYGMGNNGWSVETVHINGFFAREPHPSIGASQQDILGGLAECLNHLSIKMSTSKITVEPEFAANFPVQLEQLAATWGLSQKALSLEVPSLTRLQ
ncbi:MAG: hypothetical protein IE914_05230 [Thiotrichales bacterium]|nr:hypothetical protein [Thiotrichales bacterium]